MRIRKSPFWQRWLLHSLLIWLIINLVDVAIHVYYTTVLGIQIRDYSLWNRLLSLNLYQATPLLVLAVLLLIEINHHFFYRRTIWMFTAASLCTGLAGTLVLLLYYRMLHPQSVVLPPLSEPFWLIAAYAFVYPVVLEFINKRVFKATKLYEHSRAELQALKAQINPHFLFNTLNSLYGTALNEQATRTASSIEKLSNLMRYVLNETTADFVPVQQEIHFLDEYIGLQRMRLPEHINMRVTTALQQDDGSGMIAPLLLLPFIENAFRYGLSINHDCYINLSLLVKENRLDMNIQNSIVDSPAGAGTGINNAKQRLELLYPGKHKLTFVQTAHDYTVLLHIQLR